jgi:hypothetical protein
VTLCGENSFWETPKAVDHLRIKTLDFFNTDATFAQQRKAGDCKFDKRFPRWWKTRLEKNAKALSVFLPIGESIKRGRFGAPEMHNCRSRDLGLIRCGRKNKYLIFFTQKVRHYTLNMDAA